MSVRSKPNTTKPSKAEYEWARRKAMQQLAREHRDRYIELVEQHLGRKIDKDIAKNRLGKELG